jgi:hypothetical protein
MVERIALCLATLALVAAASTAAAQRLGPGLEPTQGQTGVLLVDPVAETIVERLPATPLFWRVERFGSVADAKAAGGPLSLAAEAWGEAWLVTLGPKGASSVGERPLAEVGPVPFPEAKRFRLRLNRAGGPPGAKTPVHTHPGSEAFYVLKGQLTQKSAHGEAVLEAGRGLNGHGPGMVMQLTSSGEESLEQLVMFVVDADKPFSVPASFD